MSNELPSKTEATQEFEYPFLQGLRTDHPELAEKVVARLPQWMSWLNENTGSEEVGNAILQKLEYVSLEEIEKSIKEWSTQVTDSLRNDERKRAFFALEGGGSGSQGYFARKVYE